MPSRPKQPCGQPGCNKLTDGKRCEDHQSKRVDDRAYDQRRGTSTERGYGWKWRTYVEAYKRRNPLCVHCLARNVITPMQAVDHVKKVSGPSDPLFWVPTNHQSLCNPCHSVKTATEDGGFGNSRKASAALPAR